MNNLLQHPTNSFRPDGDRAGDYRKALGQFPTGVTIVTCMSQIGPLGITVNSFTSVSLDPALIVWCPTKNSSRYHAFMRAKSFAVHVMPVEAKELCIAFAKSGQAFEQASWSVNDQQVPLLDGCLARFECRYFADHDGGDHSLLLGLVERVSVFDGVPLTYIQGSYNSAG